MSDVWRLESFTKSSPYELDLHGYMYMDEGDSGGFFF